MKSVPLINYILAVFFLLIQFAEAERFTEQNDLSNSEALGLIIFEDGQPTASYYQEYRQAILNFDSSLPVSDLTNEKTNIIPWPLIFSAEYPKNGRLVGLELKDSDGNFFLHMIFNHQDLQAKLPAIKESFQQRRSIISLLSLAENANGCGRIELILKAFKILGAEQFVLDYPWLFEEMVGSNCFADATVIPAAILDSAKTDSNSIINKLQFNLSRRLSGLATINVSASIALVEDFIRSNHLSGKYAQAISMRKYLLYSRDHDSKNALQALKDAELIDPKSALADRIRGLIKSFSN